MYELAIKSDEMMEATIPKDVAKMASIFDYAHDKEIPVLKYHDENSLACLVTILYCNARNWYRIIKEDVSGNGFANFIFYPLRKGDPGLVFKLKYKDTARHAIDQIKEKRYKNKLINVANTNLAVGIAYDEKKNHECIVEDITEEN